MDFATLLAPAAAPAVDLSTLPANSPSVGGDAFAAVFAQAIGEATLPDPTSIASSLAVANLPAPDAAALETSATEIPVFESVPAEASPALPAKPHLPFCPLPNQPEPGSENQAEPALLTPASPFPLPEKPTDGSEKVEAPKLPESKKPSLCDFLPPADAPTDPELASQDAASGTEAALPDSSGTRLPRPKPNDSASRKPKGEDSETVPKPERSATSVRRLKKEIATPTETVSTGAAKASEALPIVPTITAPVPVSTLAVPTAPQETPTPALTVDAAPASVASVAVSMPAPKTAVDAPPAPALPTDDILQSAPKVLVTPVSAEPAPVTNVPVPPKVDFENAKVQAKVQADAVESALPKTEAPTSAADETIQTEAKADSDTTAPVLVETTVTETKEGGDQPTGDAPHDETPTPTPEPTAVRSAGVRETAATAKPEAGADRPPVDRHVVVRQVADRIENLVAARPRDGVTIHLEPKDLGTVTLVVKGLASALDVQVSASDERVRQSLDTSRPELAQALAPRGIELREVRVLAAPQSDSPGTMDPGSNPDGRPRGQSQPQSSSTPHSPFSAPKGEAPRARSPRSIGRSVDLLA